MDANQVYLDTLLIRAAGWNPNTKDELCSARMSGVTKLKNSLVGKRFFGRVIPHSFHKINSVDLEKSLCDIGMVSSIGEAKIVIPTLVGESLAYGRAPIGFNYIKLREVENKQGEIRYRVDFLTDYPGPK